MPKPKNQEQLSIPIPLEFVILGKPISFQTANKKALASWKKIAKDAAIEAADGRTPTGNEVKLTFTYFYLDKINLPDSDNWYKPTRDALNGVIFVDDRQVSDFSTRHIDLRGSFRVLGMSRILAEGFCSGVEFVYCQITQPPDPSHLQSCTLPPLKIQGLHHRPSAVLRKDLSSAAIKFLPLKKQCELVLYQCNYQD